MLLASVTHFQNIMYFIHCILHFTSCNQLVQKVQFNRQAKHFILHLVPLRTVHKMFLTFLLTAGLGKIKFFTWGGQLQEKFTK